MPLDKPADCACFNLRRAARQASQTYDRALRRAGLLATQFSLLAVLAGADRGDGVTMMALARRLGMDRTTLTRNLAVAEREKWLTVREGADRRERLVALTAAGRRKLAAALPLWRKAQAEMRRRLGESGFTTLLEITQQIEAG